MLKVKDNVGLKELEKFGFVKAPMLYLKKIERTSEFIDETKVIYIEELTREISIKKGLLNIDVELDTIYDLIQANLVEKVED